MSVIYVVHNSALHAQLRQANSSRPEVLVVRPGEALMGFPAQAVCFVDSPYLDRGLCADYQDWVDNVVRLRLRPGCEDNLFGLPKWVERC